MSVIAAGSGVARINLYSPIMAPNHGMMMESELMGDNQGTLSSTLTWWIDGVRFVFDKRIWTPDQLADRYEMFHHQLHGYDPRGADPRNGPTRLTSFK